MLVCFAVYFARYPRASRQRPSGENWPNPDDLPKIANSASPPYGGEALHFLAQWRTAAFEAFGGRTDPQGFLHFLQGPPALFRSRPAVLLRFLRRREMAQDFTQAVRLS